MTGQRATGIAADLQTFVPGRQVDDNVQVLLRFDGGARGMLWASQLAVGNENGLRLRLYGKRGGLEWAQENPNRMTITRFGQPKTIITHGGPGTGDQAAAVTRVPAGHPEGYLEGFATIYREAAALIRGQGAALLPGLADGIDGMRFIAACIASSRANTAWVAL